MKKSNLHFVLTLMEVNSTLKGNDKKLHKNVCHALIDLTQMMGVSLFQSFALNIRTINQSATV
ncbi:hypothetical protein RND71_000395 [Anisodus tanguticus]|uniref:Uncharacterized protein n=1 Tax=Anisodus tanguticus TaxID=243964 RepID=A0AAE1VPZ5_9SOLA|nr:hypothetical protein RND71_000395 [Anisodus tanguticus]